MNYEELAKRLMDENMNYPLRKEAAEAIQRLTKERDEEFVRACKHVGDRFENGYEMGASQMQERAASYIKSNVLKRGFPSFVANGLLALAEEIRTLPLEESK